MTLGSGNKSITAEVAIAAKLGKEEEEEEMVRSRSNSALQ